MDLYGTLDRKTTTIHHYVFVQIENQPDDEQPKSLPRIIHDTSLPVLWDDISGYCSMWFSSREMVTFWTEHPNGSNNIMVGLSLVSDRDLPAKHISGLVWEAPDYDTLYYQLIHSTAAFAFIRTLTTCTKLLSWTICCRRVNVSAKNVVSVGC